MPGPPGPMSWSLATLCLYRALEQMYLPLVFCRSCKGKGNRKLGWEVVLLGSNPGQASGCHWVSNPVAMK